MPLPQRFFLCLMALLLCACAHAQTARAECGDWLQMNDHSADLSAGSPHQVSDESVPPLPVPTSDRHPPCRGPGCRSQSDPPAMATIPAPPRTDDSSSHYPLIGPALNDGGPTGANWPAAQSTARPLPGFPAAPLRPPRTR